MSLIVFTLTLIVGVIAGYVIRHYVAIYRRGSIEQEIQEKLLNAKKEALRIEDDAVSRAKEEKEYLNKLEERLTKKEEDVDKRDKMVRDEIASLKEKGEALKAIKEKLEEKEKTISKEIENIAKLSQEEAREMVLQNVTKSYEEDIRLRMLKLSRDGESLLAEKAKDILVNSVYRIANGNISNFFSSSVEIENEEIKGKIIGKEGRNIKTFERYSGVELLVDEAPNLIVVSCFDSVRRAIAVNALQMLIKDGRIQPAKIEECIEKAKKEIGTFINKKGEEAILASGVLTVPEAIVPLLGRLYFRTSYGQNVLDHSVEMAHIAGMLATELGADAHVARAGALLHDIGKAVDHEIQGTHVEIGRKILAKYGMDERVILAMQAHHEEYPYETIESVLVQVADAISGGRPGARRDTVDRYITRLSDLEAIALAFQGIERVYALQAGREIRVFVTPSVVSDVQALSLARDIALRIEQELRYPGEIKVNVIRESRVIEFAR
jgi:ribonuclease Y